MQISGRQFSVFERCREGISLALISRVIPGPGLSLVRDGDEEGLIIVHERVPPDPSTELQGAVCEGVHARLEIQPSAIVDQIVRIVGVLSLKNLGKLIGILNIFLGMVGAPEVPDPSNLAGRPLDEVVPPIDAIVKALQDVRGAIPVP